MGAGQDGVMKDDVGRSEEHTCHRVGDRKSLRSFQQEVSGPKSHL